jgi:DNA-directed RNA polymerase subunit RPC12/RpoP
MNAWLQTKQYRCPKCQAIYLHDQGHAHHCYECPFRLAAMKQQLLQSGKTYEPRVGR